MSTLILLFFVARIFSAPCQPGTFLKDDVCTPCPKGTYIDIEGATLCNRCPVGTIAPEEGTAACTRCAGEGTTSTDGLACRVCPNNVCGENEQFQPTPAPAPRFSCLVSKGNAEPVPEECPFGSRYCYVLESSVKDDERVNIRSCESDFARCKSGPENIQGLADELGAKIEWYCCVSSLCNTDVAAARASDAKKFPAKQPAGATPSVIAPGADVPATDRATKVAASTLFASIFVIVGVCHE